MEQRRKTQKIKKLTVRKSYLSSLLIKKLLLSIFSIINFYMSVSRGKQYLTNTNSKLVHEKYHAKTKVQKKIISENNFTYRLIIPVIKNYLKPKMKILDIGCGAGTLDFYLANKGYDVLGIDISGKAISDCKKSTEYLKLQNAKFQIVDFPNKSPRVKFDLVIFTEVIEHLKDDKLALRKISNLLNEDGILILSTPSKNAPLHKLGLTEKFDKDVGHLRRYDLKSLEKMCEETGLRILEAKKTEGLLRNFLFINSAAGKSVRFIKSFISDFVTLTDNILLMFFGESNFIIVARKN